MFNWKNIFGRREPLNIESQRYKPDFGLVKEVSQVASIFHWVFSHDQEVAEDCANTIHRILNAQWAFKNKSLYHSFRYIDLKPKDLETFNRFETDIKTSLLCISTMNSNGYVREAALKSVVSSPTLNSFPFILFRLADWVPNVRMLAEKGIRELIRRRESQFLIRFHKIIDWLLKIKRANLYAIHLEITDFIFSNQNIERFLNNLTEYNEGDRYFIFKNLISRGKLNQTTYEKILLDKSHLIRLLAVRNLEVIERPEILSKLLSDRSQKIRQYALNKIPSDKLNLFQDDIYKLLSDDSASIRALSRMLLSNIEEVEFREIYLTRLKENPSSGSIIGLSEVGVLEDVDTIRGYITSSSPKHRAASLYAISNLDYPTSKHEAFRLIHDTSNTVKKTCLVIIPRTPSSEDLSLLRKAYDLGNNETKRFVLRILSQYGGWSIAGDFLKAIKETDEKLQQTGQTLLNSWYNYSIRLGTEQKEQDKKYVMEIYSRLDYEEDEKTSMNSKSLIGKIPFIFGAK